VGLRVESGSLPPQARQRHSTREDIMVTSRPRLNSEIARPKPAMKAGARRTQELTVPEPERKRVFLVSGQLHVSTEPCVVTTILGSCVAVCIWEPVRGVGGATHYLLPDRVSAEHGSLRFGTLAIEHLISNLLDAGCQRANLKARVFGGASIFAGFKSIDQQLGTKNCEIAFRVLQENGIPIVDRDIGGSKGRKLIFYTDTGDARIKLL
jgi:chemotaxis protein CheD